MENLYNGNSLDTNKRYLYILIFGIALVLIVIIFVVLQSSKPKAATTVDQTSVKQSFSSQNEIPNNDITSEVTTPKVIPSPSIVLSNTPEDVTSKFYSWYISYSGNPYASGAYKSSSFLSPTFKNQISSFEPFDGVNDPIVCTVSKKTNFLIKPASAPDLTGSVSVLVGENVPDGRNLYRAVLQNLDGKWLINDFICIPR